jgi:2,3-bisphosphoglycerate-independent phosphoglycerate mutase
MMQDLANDQPHTQHTTNVVPLLYIGRDAEIAKTGALSDIAPSLLSMMGLSQPAEMTGHSLVKIK